MLSIAVSILVAAIGVAVLRASSARSRGRIVAALVCLVLGVLSSLYVGADYFTGKGIDESVLFHLEYGLSGAGFEAYSRLGAALTALLIASLIASLLAYRFLSKRSGRRFTGAGYLGSVLLLGAVGLNPATQDLAALLAPVDGEARSFARHYVRPSLEPVAQPRNLVFLYLEGLERTYFDESLFPGLIDGLRSLEREGTTFTDISQVWGTGWTIGGMVSSQCGIPLVTTPLGGNSMSGMDRFLPGALCIGDLLAQRGYRLDYMGGARRLFAGKGQFYETHGFHSVEGVDELESNLDDPGYKSAWGLYDDTLFDLAARRFEELSGSESPFGLFLLTLDTHNPYGHLSNPCREMRYGGGANSILNAVYCSDKLATQFIRRIRSSPHSANTLIVIASDHLALRNTATAQLEAGRRRNFFLVLLPENPPPQAVDKPGSMLDIAPTVLSLLGFEVDALGLGKNLMLPGHSLVETYHANVDEILERSWNEIARFWQHPSLDDGLYVDALRGELRFGERSVKTPTLVLLDEDSNVEQISFPFNSTGNLLEYAASLQPGTPVVWADVCEHVSALSSDDWMEGSTELCVAAGLLGAENMTVRRVDDDHFFRERDIADLIRTDQLDRAGTSRAIERLDALAKWGSPDVSETAVSAADGLTGSLIVRSAGFGQGASYVASAANRKKQIKLLRGLTLFGVTDESTPLKLGHVDSCDPQRPQRDAFVLRGSFADIRRYSREFEAYVVVAHGSAKCRAFDLGQLFEGLPLEKWQRIGRRQPYVGVVATDGAVYERIGEPESSLTLYLTQFVDSPGAAGEAHADGPLLRVAHAGGGRNGVGYTNSLQALDLNRDSYELFEIDFSWTSDDRLVCLHDWQGNFERIFGFQTAAPLTLAKFQAVTKSHPDFENCTLETLVEWLRANDGKRIVTDVKSRNVEALRLIASRYPEELHRFVPQIYHPDEYVPVRAMGYDEVIWTLSRFPKPRHRILDAVGKMRLYAVTMPRTRASEGLALYLGELGVRTYVHTINTAELAREYYQLGIDEIYTDWLAPDGMASNDIQEKLGRLVSSDSSNDAPASPSNSG